MGDRVSHSPTVRATRLKGSINELTFTRFSAAAVLETIHASGCNAGAAHAQMYTMGTILRHGSQEQKEFLLPKIASGEVRLQAFGVSEPNNGTDTMRYRPCVCCNAFPPLLHLYVVLCVHTSPLIAQFTPSVSGQVLKLPLHWMATIGLSTGKRCGPRVPCILIT